MSFIERFFSIVSFIGGSTVLPTIYYLWRNALKHMVEHELNVFHIRLL